MIVSGYQIVGDDMYITYGYYAGSGMFYQGGGIYRVSIEGDDDESIIEFPQITSGMIYVQQTENGTYVHFTNEMVDVAYDIWDNDWYDMSCCINAKTGVTGAFGMPFTELGSYVYMNGAMKARLDTSGKYKTIVSSDVLNDIFPGTYGEQSDESYVLVRNIEIVGNKVYFTIETSERNAQEDVGWRPSYKRVSSSVYCTTIGQSKYELVYSY